MRKKHRELAKLLKMGQSSTLFAHLGWSMRTSLLTFMMSDGLVAFLSMAHILIVQDSVIRCFNYRWTSIPANLNKKSNGCWWNVWLSWKLNLLMSRSHFTNTLKEIKCNFLHIILHIILSNIISTQVFFFFGCCWLFVCLFVSGKSDFCLKYFLYFLY